MVKINLRELREAAGLSVEGLVKLSGVSRLTINKVEKRGICRMSTAYVICKALNYPLGDFFNNEKEEQTSDGCFTPPEPQPPA